MARRVFLVGDYETKLDHEGRIYVQKPFRMPYDEHSQNIHYILVPTIRFGIDFFKVTLMNRSIHEDMKSMYYSIPSFDDLPHLDSEGRLRLTKKQHREFNGGIEEKVVVGSMLESFFISPKDKYKFFRSAMEVSVVVSAYLSEARGNNNPQAQSYRHPRHP